MVSCGRVLQDEQLLIVDPDTRTRLREDRVGEIWIHSRERGPGLLEQAGNDRKRHFGRGWRTMTPSPYLRSGDLGFFHDGELFVTGRIKDMIIVRGVNRYPQDIEMTVERARSPDSQAERPPPSRWTAGPRTTWSSSARWNGTCSDNWDEVIEAIRRDVTTEHELPPDGVILVRSGSIPRPPAARSNGTPAARAFWKTPC